MSEMDNAPKQSDSSRGLSETSGDSRVAEELSALFEEFDVDFELFDEEDEASGASGQGDPTGTTARMSLEERLAQVDRKACGEHSIAGQHEHELHDLMRRFVQILQQNPVEGTYVNPRVSFNRGISRTTSTDPGRRPPSAPLTGERVLEKDREIVSRAREKVRGHAVREMSVLWEGRYSISEEELAVNAVLWKVLGDAHLREAVFSSLLATLDRWVEAFDTEGAILRQ